MAKARVGTFWGTRRNFPDARCICAEGGHSKQWKGREPSLPCESDGPLVHSSFDLFEQLRGVAEICSLQSVQGHIDKAGAAGLEEDSQGACHSFTAAPTA